MKKTIGVVFSAVLSLFVSTAVAQESEGWIEHNVTADSVLGTQMAMSKQCTQYCRGSHEDYYEQCIEDCESATQATTEQPTMLADGGCYQQDDGSVICYGEDGSIQQSDAPRTTQFASLRVEPDAPDPLCDTDPYSCFHVPNGDNKLTDRERVEAAQQAFIHVIIMCVLWCK